MSVLKGLFLRHKVSLCHGFVLLREAVMGDGMPQLSPLKESHIFLNERPFATRLQSCFSEKAVCPLTSDISYRQEREGKEGTNERKLINNLFLAPFSTPHLFLPNMEPLSLYAHSCFEVESTFISVSIIIHPAIHPSWVFEQDLAGNAQALFPTPNIEGLTRVA